MKTKSYLTIAGVGVLLLTSLAAFSYAQQGEDDKKTKKIEKKIEIQDENGKKTVTVTTTENGKTTKKVLSGKEADDFLNKEELEIKDGDKTIKIKIKEEGNSSSQNNQTIIIDKDMSFENFAVDMDSIMKELEKEMAELGIQMDGLMKGENFKICYKINDGEKKCIGTDLEDMDITIDNSTNKGTNSSKKKIVIKMEVDEESNADHLNEKSKIEPKYTLKAYPNPAKDKVTLEFSVPTTEQTEVVVTDLQGKVLYKDKFSGQTNYKREIKTGPLSNGTYILEVKQSGFVLKEKILFND